MSSGDGLNELHVLVYWRTVVGQQSLSDWLWVDGKHLKELFMRPGYFLSLFM